MNSVIERCIKTKNSIPVHAWNCGMRNQLLMIVLLMDLSSRSSSHRHIQPVLASYYNTVAKLQLSAGA